MRHAQCLQQAVAFFETYDGRVAVDFLASGKAAVQNVVQIADFIDQAKFIFRDIIGGPDFADGDFIDVLFEFSRRGRFGRYDGNLPWASLTKRGCNQYPAA